MLIESNERFMLFVSEIHISVSKDTSFLIIAWCSIYVWIHCLCDFWDGCILFLKDALLKHTIPLYNGVVCEQTLIQWMVFFMKYCNLYYCMA